MDHIYFDLPSSTTQQISPTSDLPTITNPVYLHGLYAVDQNSYKNAPWVALDGSQINGFSTGLRFDSNNSTLQALSLTGFGYATILSGNQNQLLGNYFGIRPDGSFGANQVAVGVFGSNNQIGSGFTQDRNFIAASQSVGISLSDPNAHSNRIFGNWIGLGPGGNSPEAQGNGVSIYGASNNYIGTNGDSLNDDAEGNVISGNSSGIELINAHNNRISGNRIGTTPDGSSRLQNISFGISIYYSHETIVGTNGDGTSDSFERNLISGNGYGGITINDSNQNRIAGNYIGTNTSGSESIPNYGNGVSIRGNSTGNTIGTDSSNDAWNESERNLISGNSASGIGLSSARVSNTVIAGNLIGVDVTGTQAISNSYGVYIYKAFGTRVGTDGDGNYDSLERNVVSGNSIGVVVYGDNPDVSNMEIAQDLVDGRILSTVYTAELAQADLFDTSGAAGGNWGIDLPIPGGGGENYAVKVTGTLQVATPGVYSFAAGSDDGTRLIIDGQDVAFFWGPRSFGVSYGEMNLSGEHTIEWISFEQGGAAGFELSVSPIAGNYSDITEANGWKVLGDPNPDSQIRLKPGTVLNATAYYATGPYRFNTSIAGNFLGTDINGNTSVPNTYGIFIYNSAEIEIGGPIASMRNMISGNSQSGIYAQGTYLLSIEGNSIGLDKDGQNPIGNGFFGLELLGANDTLIKNNIIGSNVRGLQIQSANNTVVVGNTIGLAADGITQRSNTQGGLVAVYSSGMQLGTDGDGIDDALEGNLISANGGPANVALIFVNDSVVAGNTIGSTKDYALV
ncbi:MAG: PA14 domain-containing protein, partial [Pirellula sp.]